MTLYEVKINLNLYTYWIGGRPIWRKCFQDSRKAGDNLALEFCVYQNITLKEYGSFRQAFNNCRLPVWLNDK